MNNQISNKIKVIDKQGNISTISYSELTEHEEEKILDDISFGYKSLEPNESDEEILKYEKQARNRLRKLKKKLRNNPELVLTLDETTGSYVIYNQSGQKSEGKA